MKIKITFVLLIMLSTLSVFSQAKKKDTLMWFVGTWVSKTVFKADSNYVTGGAANSKITVGSNGSVSVNSASGQQLNQQITTGGNEADNMESNLNQQLQTEGFNQYHLYTFSKEAIDSAKAFYFGLKIPDAPPPGGTSSNPTYQTYNAMAAVCMAQEGGYNTIIQFWNAHRSIKNEHYDYPPPPQADYFNCWGCNRPGQKDFAAQCKQYDSTFFEPEMTMVKNGYKILQELNQMGLAPDEGASNAGVVSQTIINSLFNKSKHDPANAGPCAYLDYDYLASAMSFLYSRMQKKADQLVKDVKAQTNFGSYMPAVHVDLLAARQSEMVLGSSADNEPMSDIMANCRVLVEKLLGKLTDNLTTNHDFTYLADIPLMLSLATEDEEIGGNEDQIVSTLYRFMHYTLSLDMNIKVDLKGKGSQSAHLKGEAMMVLELDTVDCVRMILSNKEKGVITMNVIQNLMTLPQCSPTYVGTTTYTSMSPELILHFCKSGGIDTLTLAPFTAKPYSNGLWKYPCGTTPPLNQGINALDGYFNDPAAILKRAKNIATNAAANKQQLETMMANAKQQAAQIMAQMNGGGGATQAGGEASIKNILDMNNSLMTGGITNVGRLIIPVTVKTGSTLMLDQTVNAKVSNTMTQMTQLIDYGTLQIQLKAAQ